MKGTITIAGDRDYGVHIEASLVCEDILDRSYIKDIIGKLLNDNEKKEEAKE
jgi:hypothetical protein